MKVLSLSSNKVVPYFERNAVLCTLFGNCIFSLSDVLSISKHYSLLQCDINPIKLHILEIYLSVYPAFAVAHILQNCHVILCQLIFLWLHIMLILDCRYSNNLILRPPLGLNKLIVVFIWSYYYVVEILRQYCEPVWKWGIVIIRWS